VISDPSTARTPQLSATTDVLGLKVMVDIKLLPTTSAAADDVHDCDTTASSMLAQNEAC
jgi:hypothetical protein